MEQEYKYMVATRCFTFNHAPYIEDAMNGFAMQETTFPVVTLIVDDASTDGEPEVIRKYLAEHFQSPYRVEETEYANIICAKHKTNANCDFVVFLLKYNHYSIKKPKLPYLSEWNDKAKYHALCEGDDYWIEPKKLQKQVDYLELHPDYGMCHTHVLIRTEDTLTPAKYYGSSNFDSLLIGNKVHTLSVCFRRELHSQYLRDINPSEKKWSMGDYPLWLYISSRCKIHYLDITTGVYRVLPDSASHFSTPDFEKELKFKTSLYDVQSYFASLTDHPHLVNILKLKKAHASLMVKCKYAHENILEEKRIIMNAGIYSIKDFIFYCLLSLYPYLISFSLLSRILQTKHNASNRIK